VGGAAARPVNSGLNEATQDATALRQSRRALGVAVGTGLGAGVPPPPSRVHARSLGRRKGPVWFARSPATPPSEPTPAGSSGAHPLQ
jgi:hypothetical protein